MYAQAYLARIIVLKDGVCAAEGTFDDLKEKSADPMDKIIF